MQRRWPVSVLVASLPPLVLALAGLAHPMHLTDVTAGRWVALHFVLLPLFPLLALGPWLVARRASVPVARVVAVLGYVYAVCYSTLDVLAGIGAGTLQRHGDAGHKQLLFDQGNALAAVAVEAYLAATVLAVLVTLLAARNGAGRQRLRLLVPGAALVLAGAVSFLSSHVYWPRGGITLLALSLGWGLLAWQAPAGDAVDQAR